MTTELSQFERSTEFPHSVVPAMLDLRPHDTSGVLANLPAATYVMTASLDGKRSGMLVRWVSQVAIEPPLIAVAIFRGHWVETLIRDSHSFAICQIDPTDRLLLKKFGETGPRDNPRRDADPFDCIPTETLSTPSPVLKRCAFALDCTVVRHLDMEADHSLYIGQVVASRVYDSSLLAKLRAGA